MFGFGKKNSIDNPDDLKKLMKKEGKNFPNAVKAMADNGNIICQELMATVVLNRMNQAPNLETKRKIHTDFIRYATPVAKSGNSDMQFNLGLSYSKTLDSDEDYIDQDGLNRLREARYWMREAADQGKQAALDSFHSLDKLIFNIETRLEDEDEDEDEDFTILDQLKLASEHVKFSKTMEELHPRDFGDVKGVIQDIGLERASQLYAHIVRQKIKNRKDRLQFILEELDGASQGIEKSKAFVRNSGIPASKYSGAIDRSYPAVDGLDGPQQFLRMASMRLMSNQELMVDFTLSVVRRIMDDHGL